MGIFKGARVELGDIGTRAEWRREGAAGNCEDGKGLF